MSETIGCWTCGSGNHATATRCWVCHSELRPDAPRAPAAPLPHHEPRSAAGTIIGWMSGLFALFVVSVLVAIELAIHWPGMLVPYALVSTIVLSVLAVSAYGQVRQVRKGKAVPSAAETLAYGAVLGTTTVLLGLAMIVLLFVTATVVFFLICLGIIGTSGLH